MADFTIDSLTGGLDDHTPISQLSKASCQIAENVEFHTSALGERRAGCESVPLPPAVTANPLFDAVTWAGWFQPSEDATADELWVLCHFTDNTVQMHRLTSSGWHAVAFPTANDTPLGTGVYPYRVYAVSLHGKFYLAYKSAVDRLHVWDGVSVRRVGLGEPGVPSAANGGGAGVMTLRYYRVRAIAKSGAVVLRRSEPSVSTSITPAGANSVVVTKGTMPGEGETHWEVEGSKDDSFYYVLQTVAIGTGTWEDTTDPANYADNIQSADIGSFDLIPSVVYLSTDNDRLMTGGAWETVADQSALRWTPVGTDPLPGPDERFNTSTNPRIDLDGFDGGSMTGLSKMIQGSLLALKQSHVYKVLRTGQLVGAYEAVLLTTTLGALQRSLVDASDQAGRPALYFLDPDVGPMRSGAQGIQFIGDGVFNLWARINLNATVPCHGVYYKAKKQIHWWVALDSDLFPTTKIIIQTDAVTSANDEAATGGWTMVPSPCRIAAARCSVMFHSDITTANLAKVPFIGKSTWQRTDADGHTYGLAVTDCLQRCDVGSTDAATANDYGSAYFARIRTRPFLLTGLLNEQGILAGALFAKAGGSVQVNLIGDFGRVPIEVPVDLTPDAAEAYVVTALHDFSMAGVRTVEIEFTDDETAANKTQWELLQFGLKPTTGQTP